MADPADFAAELAALLRDVDHDLLVERTRVAALAEERETEESHRAATVVRAAAEIHFD